ncbi:uncharacterized protein LOC135202336 [Macrobrachium nipponense]|uniref:uncharacterized protein LOC135202336 n=1 Tax=Macrobrachium nipponense TaxID=159736 RepID=UPI0030C8AE4E
MEETDGSTYSPEQSLSGYLDDLVVTDYHGLELLSTDDPLSAAPSGTDGPCVPAEIPGDGNEVLIKTPFCGVGLPQGMSCQHKIVDPTSSSPGGHSSNPKKKKKKKKTLTSLTTPSTTSAARGNASMPSKPRSTGRSLN